PQHAACVAVRERDLETVRRRVRKSMDAICQEIVIFHLFAVRDDWRSRGFEPIDGVPDCTRVERGKGGILAVEVGEFWDESGRPRNAADGLRGYAEPGRRSVG